MDALELCENNAWWKSFDGIDECEGEGYVMWNRYGTYKLVDRDEFSRLNFLTQGDWTPKNCHSSGCIVYCINYNKYIHKGEPLCLQN